MGSRPRLAEVFDADARAAELEALASRQAGRIAFLNAKVAWLTLDRDRFRQAHGQIVRSLLWRITTPFRTRALQAATRALHAHAQRQGPADPVTIAVEELPEAAVWLRQKLVDLSK